MYVLLFDYYLGRFFACCNAGLGNTIRFGIPLDRPNGLAGPAEWARGIGMGSAEWALYRPNGLAVICGLRPFLPIYGFHYFSA